MKKLQSFSITQLAHLDLVQFLRDTQTDISKTALSLLQNDSPLKRYMGGFASVDTFEKGTINAAGNPMQDKLTKADQARDIAFRNVRRRIRYFEYSEDEAEREAALTLLPLWNVHKSTPDMQPQKQTSATDNFLSDLAKPEYAPAVETLKLQPDVERVKTTNNAYRTLWDDQRSKEIQQEVIDTKNIRMQLLGNYRDMADYILSMAKAHADNAEWSKLLDAINVTRTRYAETMTRRKAAAEAAAKKREQKAE